MTHLHWYSRDQHTVDSAKSCRDLQKDVESCSSFTVTQFNICVEHVVRSH